MTEKINHPKHYNSLPATCDECGAPIECIQVVRHMDFNTGNVVKYLWRLKHKGDQLEDLKKARWYLDDKISRLEADLVEIEEKLTKNLDDERFGVVPK